MSAPLPEAFYARDALAVARDLLGARLVRGPVVLRITEVEAYRWPDDSANHCRSGRTARNAPIWGPPGRAYVYLVYGLHQLLNLVTDAEGHGAAVLIRAAEPVAGHDLVASRRGRSLRPDVLAGPGKVAQALGVDTTWSHHPVFEPGGLEVRPGAPPDRVLIGPRIGVGYAEPADVAAPWRLAAPSRWVSHRRSLREEDA